MNSTPRRIAALILFVLLVLPAILPAQGTKADYERAIKLRERFQGLAVNIMETPAWIEKTSRFWYRKSVKGGYEFVLVDAASPAKRPAFDHARLAASLSTAAGEKYTALTLPFHLHHLRGQGKRDRVRRRRIALELQPRGLRLQEARPRPRLRPARHARRLRRLRTRKNSRRIRE